MVRKNFLTISLLFLNSVIVNSKDEENRTINGYFTKPGQFPWYALLRHQNIVCGGTLISNHWVLTAAHCVYREVRRVKLYLGSTNWEKGYKINIRKITIHPKYDELSFERDIALLKLPKKIKYTEHVQPALLPPKWMKENPEILNNKLYFLGYGWYKIGAVLKSLRHTTLKILPVKKCEHSSAGPMTRDKICTQSIHSNISQNVCIGDSGGGVILKWMKKHYIIGIASYITLPLESECNYELLNAVLQSVFENLEWIVDLTKIEIN